MLAVSSEHHSALHNKIDQLSQKLQINTDVKTLFERGSLYEQALRWDDAASDYSSILLLEPANIKALERRALCYERDSRFSKAAKDYTRALEVSQDSITWLNFRSVVWIKLKDFPKAIQDATTVISLDVNNGPAYGTRSLAHLMLGNISAAQVDSDKCKQLRPEARRPHYIEAIILEQKQEYKQAYDKLKYYLSLNHEDASLVASAKHHLNSLEALVAKEEQTTSSKKPTVKYSLFLSHYQRTGGLLAMVLKLLLENRDPTLKIFLDVDDLENIHDLKHNVVNSDNFALLLTDGVFERRFVMEELDTALTLNKNIILVWDKDRCPFPDAEQVPERVREVLTHRAIIWSAEKEFREVVISQILQKMHLPHNAGVPNTASPRPGRTMDEKLSSSKLLTAVPSDFENRLVKVENDLKQVLAGNQGNNNNSSPAPNNTLATALSAVTSVATLAVLAFVVYARGK